MQVARGVVTLLLVGLLVLDASSQTVVGGKASGQWTSAGSPYLFAGFVVVQDGSLLEIDPGVEIQLMGKGLYVGYETAGELQADGVRIVGPGEIRFFSQEYNMGLGLGWIKNSEFVDDALISFGSGGAPLLEGNSGVGSISLTDMPTLVTGTWTLPPVGLPYLIDNSITVSPTGQLILEGISLKGNGSITFLSSGDGGQPEDSASRIIGSDFTGGPDVVVFPGANLIIHSNPGLESLKLPGQNISGPGPFNLDVYEVPYIIDGSCRLNQMRLSGRRGCLFSRAGASYLKAPT